MENDRSGHCLQAPGGDERREKAGCQTGAYASISQIQQKAGTMPAFCCF